MGDSLVITIFSYIFFFIKNVVDFEVRSSPEFDGRDESINVGRFIVIINQCWQVHSHHRQSKRCFFVVREVDREL